MCSYKRFIAQCLIIMMVSTGMPQVFAAHELTMILREINLADVIMQMAKFMHMNVIISKNIRGIATLNLQNANIEKAFELLLTTHGLAQWHKGNVTYIAPREELIKLKEEELKWQAMLDQSAKLITRLYQIKYANASDIAHMIQDDRSSFLSTRGSVHVDKRTNIIFVEDPLPHIQQIEKLITRLDVPIKQILIKARLASVDHDVERELGINFGVTQASSRTDKGEKGWAEGRNQYSLAVMKLADGSLLDVKLSALESAGHAELISSPSLLTANQQQASIESGEEVPYQQVSESGGTAVVFKKAVLGLHVIPQVLPGDRLLLKLQFNQDRPSNKMVQGVPTISTRQMETNVLLKAGETVVLGGIYESTIEKGETGLPLISRLPIVGWLVKQQTVRQKKRELLIFVTPTIIA